MLSCKMFSSLSVTFIIFFRVCHALSVFLEMVLNLFDVEFSAKCYFLVYSHITLLHSFYAVHLTILCPETLIPIPSFRLTHTM